MIAGDQLGLTGSIPSADKPLRWICLLALFPAIVLFPICDAIAPVGRALQYLGFVPEWSGKAADKLPVTLAGCAAFHYDIDASHHVHQEFCGKLLCKYSHALAAFLRCMPPFSCLAHRILPIICFSAFRSTSAPSAPSAHILHAVCEIWEPQVLISFSLIHAFFSLRIAIHLIRAYLRSDSDRFTCLECGSHAIKRTPRHGAAWHEPSERPRNYDYVGEYGDDDEPLIGGSVN
ncbi:MAG: hypothetical protein Q9157_008607 [Trypethelium eluteriae]